MEVTFDTERLAAIAAREHDAYARAQPFPHAVIDGLLRDDAAAALAAAIPGPDAAAVAWDRYAAAGFEWKLGSANQAQLPAAVVPLLHGLNSAPITAIT